MKLFALLCFFIGAGADARAQVSSSYTHDGGYTVDKSLFKPHVGLAAGAGIPEGSRHPGFEFTLSAGSRLYTYVPLLLGLEFSTVEFGGEGREDDFRRVAFFLKSVYQFKSYRFRHLYAGLALGPTWERTGPDDGVFFAFAPHAGMDFPLRKTLSNNISIGGEARYLVSTGHPSAAFSLSGTVKFWF